MDEVASRPLITVIASFQGSSGFKINGSSPSGPSLMAQCPGSQPCGLKMPTNRGTFTVASALAAGTRAGNIESNNGSASVTPAPRKKVRRGICFLLMSTVRLSLRLTIHLKRGALDNFEHHCRKAIIVHGSFAYDRANYRHIVVLYPTSHPIREQLLLYRPH